SQTIPAQEHPPTLLVSVDHRKSISLDGDWHSMYDPYATGLYDFHGGLRSNGYFKNQQPRSSNDLVEYDFQKSPTLRVPGDWNTQRESLFLYEGPMWYEKDFTYQKQPGTRVFFHVGAANYRSYVWVNGSKACEHEGGFTPFDCEITDIVHDGANFAVIAVDSTRMADGLPTLQTDWWNYGGLTRDVSLVEVPEQFVDDYALSLKRGSKTELEGWAHLDGAAPGTSVTVTIPEQGIKQTAAVQADGRAQFHLNAPKLELWSPEHPKLYRVQIEAGGDRLEDEVGFRTIEARGTEILLNGSPIFLRGVCIHAEAPYRTGRAYSQQDATTLLGWAHELGANFVRLAHYPHDERMTRLADRMGILVWSEVPVYWAVQFDNPAVLAKGLQQLHEMIRRDRNKASVILWSVANETPATPARTEFLKKMVTSAHEQDPTRLVTAALLVRTEGMKKIVDDALGSSLDVIGVNEYIGWYEHKPEDADQTVWQIAYEKPMIVSEFGGDAKAGLHGNQDTRWTEEYQANIYRHQFVMLNRIPQLRGMTPWILMDFRSPRRPLPGIEDYFNRKGLISDQGVKKQAFYVLQQAYKQGSVGKAH
ncbi:MAG TPA: glycoside hydrolase family 2 TIM barrel-domain containing protein, partial [Terriglobales bacterium]